MNTPIIIPIRTKTKEDQLASSSTTTTKAKSPSDIDAEKWKRLQDINLEKSIHQLSPHSTIKKSSVSKKSSTSSSTLTSSTLTSLSDEEDHVQPFMIQVDRNNPLMMESDSPSHFHARHQFHQAKIAAIQESNAFSDVPKPMTYTMFKNKSLKHSQSDPMPHLDDPHLINRAARNFLNRASRISIRHHATQKRKHFLRANKKRRANSNEIAEKNMYLAQRLAIVQPKQRRVDFIYRSRQPSSKKKFVSPFLKRQATSPSSPPPPPSKQPTQMHHMKLLSDILT
mmetsp:Transcript_11895/g.17683  ORF Transcript_11895/g.17683 Transcript_11895/m.17683 type:complete len:283 (+) Transcript_11895:191-1039(+)